MSKQTISILKSTSALGINQAFVLVIGMIKTKIIALLLGASGFGYFSLFSNITNLFVSYSNLGLQTGGVRNLAICDDKHKIAVTVKVLCIALLTTSLIATVIMCAFSRIISNSLFGTPEHYLEIIIISPVVLFTGLNNFQLAVLNGMHKIKYLVLSKMCASFLSAIATVVIIYMGGRKVLSIAFACASLILYLSGLPFVRRLKIRNVKITMADFICVFKSLISVGGGVYLSGLVYTLMAYISTVYINRTLGSSALGIYSSCWHIANLYVYMILSAIGVDFLPRITRMIKLNHDRTAVQQCLNEQIALGSFLFLPAGIFIFIFAPLILPLLYAENFASGASILRWQTLGVFMRVIAFPLGHLLIAYSKSLLYFFLQTGFYLLEFLFLTIVIKYKGFGGLGINYPIAYFMYMLVLGISSVVTVGFRPNKKTLIAMLATVLFSSLAVFVIFIMESYWQIICGVLLSLSCGLCSLAYIIKVTRGDIASLFKRKQADE